MYQRRKKGNKVGIANVEIEKCRFNFSGAKRKKKELLIGCAPEKFVFKKKTALGLHEVFFIWAWAKCTFFWSSHGDGSRGEMRTARRDRSVEAALNTPGVHNCALNFVLGDVE